MLHSHQGEADGKRDNWESLVSAAVAAAALNGLQKEEEAVERESTVDEAHSMAAAMGMIICDREGSSH